MSEPLVCSARRYMVDFSSWRCSAPRVSVSNVGVVLFGLILPFHDGAPRSKGRVDSPESVEVKGAGSGKRRLCTCPFL
jgi:hypothetical protein